ncbi:MAG: ABC transporter permease [Flavitalea sp.]
MLNNLRTEWLKIKNYKAFWIFLGLYLVSIVAINYIAYAIYQETVKQEPMAASLINNPYAFPAVWGTVGFMGSWLLYFPGIIIILLTSNEFTFKTHRQNIIDGWSRKDFVHTKLLLVLILAITTTIISTITAFGFGLASGESFSTDGMMSIVYIFVQSLSYISLALLLAVLFRRSGVALIVFFLYGLIFETIIYGLINRYINDQGGYFLPLQGTDVLLPLPFGNNIIYKHAPQPYVLIITSLIYLGLYYFFLMRKFERDDL